MTADQASVICWLRRDLRLADNTALAQALATGLPVVCVFIFDHDILHPLPRDDRRVEFMWQTLQALKTRLAALGSDLLTIQGTAVSCLVQCVRQFNARTVFAAEDVEPQARARDALVRQQLKLAACELRLVNDQLLQPPGSLLTSQGRPFQVFTPFKRAWLAAQPPDAVEAVASTTALHRLMQLPPSRLPTLEELGFSQGHIGQLRLAIGEQQAQQQLKLFAGKIKDYATTRDFPSNEGTSALSPQLRFGTLSIRQAVALARASDSAGHSAWLNELIWREFYQHVLWHNPHVTTESFKARYRTLHYPNRQDWFECWRQGMTGYPIIDAGMRQLRATGWMHNRVRMLTASFLVKDLLIDWRWGEAYFAQLLLDFDLAANNGGWQWSASTGCDAQPWFRIFNPLTQSRRFDPQGEYIRRWVPELAQLSPQHIHAPAPTSHYPAPIVEHAAQRKHVLALYASAPG